MHEVAWLVREVAGRYLVVGIDRHQAELIQDRKEKHLYFDRRQAKAVAARLQIEKARVDLEELRREDRRCTEVMKRV